MDATPDLAESVVQAGAGRSVSGESYNNRANGINNVSDFPENKGKQSGSIVSSHPVGVVDALLSMPESYGEINIDPVVFHVWGRGVEGVRYKFRAVFDFSKISGDIDTLNQRVFWPTEANISVYRGRVCKTKQFVFVRVIQIPENGQGCRKFWVPAMVRLDCLDCGSHVLTNSDQTFPFGFSERRAVVTDGERDTISIGRRIQPRFMSGNRVDEMVKRASKVVDCVSDDKTPSLERGGVSGQFSDEAVMGTVGITLLNCSVRATFHPGAGFASEGFRVFLSPRELCIDAIEI